MRKFILVVCLLYFFLTLGCAALIIPTLMNRELRIHPTGKLYYDYCLNYGMFSNNCKEWKTEFYDLSDPDINKQLADFTCKHKTRPF